MHSHNQASLSSDVPGEKLILLKCPVRESLRFAGRYSPPPRYSCHIYDSISWLIVLG